MMIITIMTITTTMWLDDDNDDDHDNNDKMMKRTGLFTPPSMNWRSDGLIFHGINVIATIKLDLL